ncbi:AAA family ATPase [Thermodesulfatator autotrophicus]|uniref:YhaN AAA domain-containing protein n=1 Tax=Thermodesulfatator autotrophicus TaxID=1795632 RepID=A0A177E922_9BACT|nr:AAA family ATPase [Thermodesulfatator autotrophicus]OAG28206.1 hypothetical protein TH606_02855 [Thermodesulfatator autotrophicus]
MKLRQISFRNYKILSDHEFSFEPGLKVITKPNEYGKSTLIEGILDVFSLNPKALLEKTTKGQKVPPVIKLKFDIGEHRYELKLSGLEPRPYLRGSDGVDLESPESIKKFLEKKGYKHFRQVLEGLLVLRERDLSTAVKSGLQEVFDQVLKSASIEGLEKKIKDDFILQRGGLRQNPFGRLEQETLEKLEEINDKLALLEKEKKDFEENKKKLEVIKEKLEKFLAKHKELTLQKEQLGYLQAYLEIEHLENKIKRLREEEKALVTKIEKLARERETLKKKIEDLREEEKKLLSEVAQSENIEKEKKLLEDRQKQLKKELERKEEYQKLIKALGPLATQNPEKLQDYLNEWQAFLKIARHSRGKLEVLKAKDNLLINGKKFSAREVEFQGKINIKYNDLELNIYPQVKLAELSKNIAPLEKAFSTPENLKQIIQNLRKLKQIESSLESTEDLPSLKEKLRKTQKDLESLAERQNKVSQKKNQAKELGQQIKTFEKKLRELEKKYLALREGLAAKKQEIKNLETKIKEYPRDFEEKLSLKTIRTYEGESLERITRLLNQVSTELESLQQDITLLERDKTLYEDRVARKPDLNRYEELLEKKKALERKLLRFKRLEVVLRASADILSQLKERINQAYLEKFEEKVTQIFGEITDGRYTSVSFNFPSLFFDKEAFQKRWKVKREDGRVFHIDSLSDGTRVQLLLAARLALVELFFNDKAFFLLDEPLAYFDQKRARRTLNIFNSLTKAGWQIIIMSARPLS